MKVNKNLADGFSVKKGDITIVYAERQPNADTTIKREIWYKGPTHPKPTAQEIIDEV